MGLHREGSVRGLEPPGLVVLEHSNQRICALFNQRLHPRLAHVVLTDFGFQQFADAFDPDYNEMVARIAALLVNENVCENEALASRIQRLIGFVNFVLNIMESNHIKLSKYIGGQSQVWPISPSLRRLLQQA